MSEDWVENSFWRVSPDCGSVVKDNSPPSNLCLLNKTLVFKLLWSNPNGSITLICCLNRVRVNGSNSSSIKLGSPTVVLLLKKVNFKNRN